MIADLFSATELTRASGTSWDASYGDIQHHLDLYRRPVSTGDTRCSSKQTNMSSSRCSMDLSARSDASFQMFFFSVPTAPGRMADSRGTGVVGTGYTVIASRCKPRRSGRGVAVDAKATDVEKVSAGGLCRVLRSTCSFFGSRSGCQRGPDPVRGTTPKSGSASPAFDNHSKAG